MEELLNRNCLRRKFHMIDSINRFFESIAKNPDLEMEDKEEVICDFQERVDQEIEYILDLY